MNTADENNAKKGFRIRWDWFPVTFLIAFFCCFLWGSASPAIKIAYQLFRIDSADTASRILLAGSRFTLAGCMTIIFGSLLSGRFLRPEKSSVPRILLLALVQTVGQYYFFFMALANTSGVRGSIINASGNFLAILFAVYIFRLEKMTLRKLLGCVIGFAGILLVLGGVQGLVSGGALRLEGEGAMLAATVFYAASGCMIKIFSREENPVVLSGYQFFLGGLILLAVGALTGGRLVFYSPSCAFNLLYMGFISAGAYTLWGILLKYNPVSKVSILGFINPIMGVLLSALFLHEGGEAFSAKNILALLLVCIGIVVVNFTGHRSRSS